MIQIDDLRMRKHDALNWAIEQRHITLKWATAWSNIGYCPSLEIAARNLFIKAISEKDGIPELIQTIENAKNALIRDLAAR